MLPRELEAAVFVVVAAAALEHEAVAAAACRDASIGDKVGEKRAGSSIAQGQKKCDCFPLALFFRLTRRGVFFSGVILHGGSPPSLLLFSRPSSGTRSPSRAPSHSARS